MKAKTGDFVKVLTEDAEYEGILMPRPEILEKGITIIKLDNGYNIGIENNKIKNIEKVKDYTPKEQKQKSIPKKKNLPTVSVLSFGGTISSKVDYRTGGTYADYTAEDFVNMAPEISDIANVKARKVSSKMSEDFTAKDWKSMAEEIKKEVDEGVSGVVVTQGTDTLHFSTAAMSFMLQNLPVPVVFTASQRSIDRGSSDAFMNLVCAVSAAANFDGAEVMTCLHGSSDDEYCLLIRGSKVRKMHTSRRDAFRPVNAKPFAKVYSNGVIEIIDDDYKPREKRTPELKNKFDDKTALLYVYPNFDPNVISYYVNKDYRGLVIAGTALGHVNSDGRKNVLPYIENAIEAGLIVVIASQTLYGSTHKYVYSNLRKLSVQLGCEFAEDCMPETAYVKLGWAIANSKSKDEAKEMFRTDISGEFSEKSSYETFLY